MIRARPLEDPYTGVVHIEIISQHGGIQIPFQETPSKGPTNRGKSSKDIVGQGKIPPKLIQILG